MPSRIAVVGAGLIGCAAALELARGGHKVTVYDKGEVGRESSWAAGGVLTPVHIADYPAPLAELCLASRRLFPSFVESLEAPGLEHHACGMMLLILDDDDERDARTLEDWNAGTGLTAERLTPEEARRAEPWLTSDLRGALWLPEVAQVRNNRLTPAVAAAAGRLGVEFRTHHFIDDLNTLPADRVVLAAGSWSGKLAPHVQVRPARGQMILVAAPPKSVRSILLWKDRYVIPRRDGHMLLGSTVEDVGFDTRVTEEGLAEIRKSVGRFAPKVAALPVERTWSGLRPRTPDRLPVLGAEGKVVHATGHFRNGILLAPVTARLVREVIEERTPSIRLEPFSASRFQS